MAGVFSIGRLWWVRSRLLHRWDDDADVGYAGTSRSQTVVALGSLRMV